MILGGKDQSWLSLCHMYAPNHQTSLAHHKHKTEETIHRPAYSLCLTAVLAHLHAFFCSHPHVLARLNYVLWHGSEPFPVIRHIGSLPPSPQTCPLQHALYPPSVCLSIQWLMDLALSSSLLAPKPLAISQITWNSENAFSHVHEPTHSCCFRPWGTYTVPIIHLSLLRSEATLQCWSVTLVRNDTQTQNFVHKC